MLIEVLVQGWEQDCCGTAFRMGDTAGWTLFAAEPRARADLPFFYTDEHDQVPVDVPHWRVDGTVTAISGLFGQTRHRPGSPRTHEGVFDRALARPVDGVDDSDVHREANSDFDDYLVTLEVPSGTSLPAYVDSRRDIELHAAEALAEARNQAARLDAVGMRLEALADDIECRFGGVAQITRSTSSSAISVRPDDASAADIHWSREDGQDEGTGLDWIRLHVADASWTLAASEDSADYLGGLVEAVVAGRVEETFDRSGPHVLTTRVVARDRQWSDTKTAEGPGRPGTYFSAPEWLMSRLDAGAKQYAPWC